MQICSNKHFIHYQRYLPCTRVSLDMWHRLVTILMTFALCSRTIHGSPTDLQNRNCHAIPGIPNEITLLIYRFCDFYTKVRMSQLSHATYERFNLEFLTLYFPFISHTKEGNMISVYVNDSQEFEMGSHFSTIFSKKLILMPEIEQISFGNLSLCSNFLSQLRTQPKIKIKVTGASKVTDATDSRATVFPYPAKIDTFEICLVYGDFSEIVSYLRKTDYRELDKLAIVIRATEIDLDEFEDP